MILPAIALLVTCLFLFGSEGDDLGEGTKLGGGHVLRPDHGATVACLNLGRARLCRAATVDCLAPMAPTSTRSSLGSALPASGWTSMESLDEHRLRFVEVLLPLVDRERISCRSRSFGRWSSDKGPALPILAVRQG